MVATATELMKTFRDEIFVTKGLQKRSGGGSLEWPATEPAPRRL
jgi:hypothetical protein